MNQDPSSGEPEAAEPGSTASAPAVAAPASAPTAAPPSGGPGSQAVIVLVLGILGLASCQILGPIAWYLGHQELKAIRASGGAASAQDEGLALAGKILGIIATAVLAMVVAFGFAWLIFAGLIVLGTL